MTLPDYNRLNRFERNIFQNLRLNHPQRALSYLIATLDLRQAQDEIRWGGYTLNVQTRLLQYKTKTIKLRPIECKIMEYVLIYHSRGMDATISDVAQHIYWNPYSLENIRPLLTRLKKIVPTLKVEFKQKTDRRKVFILKKIGADQHER